MPISACWDQERSGNQVREIPPAPVSQGAKQLPGWLSRKEPSCNAGDLGSISGSERSPGERNANPLQYSCLENPMDRGTSRATVHGVSKSQIRLKRTNMHTSSFLAESPLKISRSQQARLGPGTEQSWLRKKHHVGSGMILVPHTPLPVQPCLRFKGRNK